MTSSRFLLFALLAGLLAAPAATAAPDGWFGARVRMEIESDRTAGLLSDHPSASADPQLLPVTFFTWGYSKPDREEFMGSPVVRQLVVRRPTDSATPLLAAMVAQDDIALVLHVYRPGEEGGGWSEVYRLSFTHLVLLGVRTTLSPTTGALVDELTFHSREWGTELGTPSTITSSYFSGSTETYNHSFQSPPVVP